MARDVLDRLDRAIDTVERIVAEAEARLGEARRMKIGAALELVRLGKELEATVVLFRNTVGSHEGGKGHVSAEEFADWSEVKAFAESLRERLSGVETARHRLAELARSIERSHIRPPREWTRQKIKMKASQKDAAVESLRLAQQSETPPVLPGEVDGDAWMAWFLGLQPYARVDLIDALDLALCDLAAYLTDLEAGVWEASGSADGILATGSQPWDTAHPLTESGPLGEEREGADEGDLARLRSLTTGASEDDSAVSQLELADPPHLQTPVSAEDCGDSPTEVVTPVDCPDCSSDGLAAAAPQDSPVQVAKNAACSEIADELQGNEGMQTDITSLGARAQPSVELQSTVSAKSRAAVGDSLPTPIGFELTDDSAGIGDLASAWETRSRRDVAVLATASDSQEAGIAKTRRACALAIRDGKYALAYQIAACHEEVRPESPLDVPSSILKALVLGPLATTQWDSVAVTLLPVFPEITSLVQRLGGTDDREMSLRLLALAAALQPAFLAPHTRAVDVLRSLQGSLPDIALASAANTIIDFVGLGIDVTAGTFASLHPRGQLEERLVSQQEKCAEWLQRSRRGKIKYAPASDVWHDWLEPNGYLGRLFGVVADDSRNEDALATLSEALGHLEVNKEVCNEIDLTDDRLRGKAARLKRIEAKAKLSLVTKAREAADLLGQWLELVRTLAALPQKKQQQRIADFRDSLIPVLSQALSSLREKETDGETEGMLPLAEKVVVRSLEGVIAVVSGKEAPAPQVRAAWPELLNGPLLWYPEWALNENMEPTIRDEGLLLELVEDALLPTSASIESRFQRFCDRADLSTGEQLLQYLASWGMGTVELDRMNRVLARRLEEREEALGQEADLARQEIAKAVNDDLLSSTECTNLAQQVELTLSAGPLKYGLAKKAFSDIHARLADVKRDRAKAVLDDLARTDFAIQFPAENLKVIKYIDDGELVLAQEYMACVREGKEIAPPETVGTMFDAFFPRFVSEMSGYLGSGNNGPNRRQLLDCIARGEGFGPVELSHLRQQRLAKARRGIEAWNQLSGTYEAKRLEVLLSELGFENATARLSKTVTAMPAFDVSCDSIADRRICPIPHYGSLAKGQYRFVVPRPDSSAEELVGQLAKLGGAQKLVVLWRGPLDERGRREVARVGRSRRLSFIVFDECLAYFAFTQADNPLRAFFECSLGFSFINEAYVTSAGLVPEELFYGREAERRAVFDPLGPCLVYGGRQLGKTALLRDVERRFHRVDEGVLVHTIDLKAREIGTVRPPREVWDEIGATLRSDKLALKELTGPEGTKKFIKDWLNELGTRRMVFLLDEADAFLDADSSPPEGESQFSTLNGLKHLMDITERRFKVVLAGLHNVQRVSRDPNTPLAHLGTPLCIGPLLENGEHREALALIRNPLGALGYRFASPELPLRILSHSNYFPSLIQIFCSRLLKMLYDKQVHHHTNNVPPYVITTKDIDSVYRDPELRRSILNRFTWTLDLDPRYRVLALRIALLTVDEPSSGLAQGFGVSTIRDACLEWAPKSFQRDHTDDAFRAVLDEMVGLGVLRTVGGKYALRSPNVLNLLGTESEVNNAFLEALTKEDPPRYEPRHFRRVLREAHFRSPLTASQESRLLGPRHDVSVLFGSPLAGLGLIRDAIDAARRSGVEVEYVGNITDSEAFQLRLVASSKSDPTDRQTVESTRVIVVLPDCPWNLQWVSFADELIGRKSSKRHFVRVLFVGAPNHALEWCRDPQPPASVSLDSLLPWSDYAVRGWVRDTGFGPGNSEHALNELMEVTGGWTELIHEAAALAGRHAAEKLVRSSLLEGLLSRYGSSELFGESPAFCELLEVLRTWGGPMTQSELRDMLAEAMPDSIGCAIRACERLGYLRPLEQGRWSLDPVVSDLLSLVRS